MNDLRSLFPTQIIRGALLRPDGVAVGLVTGGAPPWDLLARDARAQTGDDYHRLLLAQHAPLDIYLIDHTPDLAAAIDTLLTRREHTENDAHIAIVEAIAERLGELAQQSGSRAKHVVWAISVIPSAQIERGGLDITTRLARATSNHPSGPSPARLAALAQAVERARQLADALAPLGGLPPARIMEAEEIARLVYQLADPVRAQRYPLNGTLMNRVQRIVTAAMKQ